jgi:hypothetical protein
MHTGVRRVAAQLLAHIPRGAKDRRFEHCPHFFGTITAGRAGGRRRRRRRRRKIYSRLTQ